MVDDTNYYIYYICSYVLLAILLTILINTYSTIILDPGNDTRYVNYVQDLDISYFETAIRSLAAGKLEIHRQFPKSESLKDCK